VRLPYHRSFGDAALNAVPSPKIQFSRSTAHGNENGRRRDTGEPVPRPFGHAVYVLVEGCACTPVLLWDLAVRCGMRGAANEDPAAAAPPYLRDASSKALQAVDPPPIVGGSPMLLERLTAWTLVVVYYTITCGAIVLGLRGAL